MAKWYDVWSWPLAMAEEARAWWIFRRVSRSEHNAAALASCDPPLRVDLLGRIYAVVNVPEEMREPDKEPMHVPYVIDKLSGINEVLMGMRLSDMAYPEVIRVPDTWSYLVVIGPVSDTSLTWMGVLGWVRRAATVAGIAFLLDRLLRKVSGQGAVELLFSLFR